MTRPDEERPIDLSALALEPARFDALLAATLARTDAVMAGSPLELIASWSRPLLLAAATLILALVPVELVLERRETRVEQVERLVTLSAELDYSAGPPSPSVFLRALSAEAQP